MGWLGWTNGWTMGGWPRWKPSFPLFNPQRPLAYSKTEIDSVRDGGVYLLLYCIDIHTVLNSKGRGAAGWITAHILFAHPSTKPNPSRHSLTRICTSCTISSVKAQAGNTQVTLVVIVILLCYRCRRRCNPKIRLFSTPRV